MPLRLARIMIGATLCWAGACLAQPPYKSVGADGKVVYSDKPPSAAAAVAGGPTPAPMPMPAAPAMAGRPGAAGVQPIVAGAPPVMPAVPRDMARQNPGMEAYRSCVRDNARTLELARAAEEVARSAANLRAQGSRAAVTDHQRSLLERQWQYYKSVGGTAATPDAVQVPADPCAPIAETLRRQQMEDYAQYRQCAAERERDVRLATLSKELVESRSWIAAAERMQAERAANPARFQDTRGSGEWARLARIDPAQLRAAQGAMFLEYRASGGPAARVEDVIALPNPCIQRTLAEGEWPQGTSPISAVRAGSVPGR